MASASITPLETTVGRVKFLTTSSEWMPASRRTICLMRFHTGAEGGSLPRSHRETIASSTPLPLQTAPGSFPSRVWRAASETELHRAAVWSSNLTRIRVLLRTVPILIKAEGLDLAFTGRGRMRPRIRPLTWVCGYLVTTVGPGSWEALSA